MPTDKTPRDADETLALPVTDSDPTPKTADDDTAVITSADIEQAAGGTAASAVDPTPTLALPGTDETAHPSTSAWGSQDEPAAYTSPIGALYAPADRPDPAPADRPDPARPDRRTADPVVVDPAPTEAPRRRLRVGTVVWGLVIAAIGVGLLAWAAGFAIDLQLAMIVLLAVAGTALLVGSIVSGARAARR